MACPDCKRQWKRTSPASAPGLPPGNPAAPQLSSSYKGLVDAAALRMKLRCATAWRSPSRCGCQRNTHSHDSDGKTVSVADVAADFQPEPGASDGAHRPLIPLPPIEGPCEKAERGVRNASVQGYQGVCFALRFLSAQTSMDASACPEWGRNTTYPVGVLMS